MNPALKALIPSKATVAKMLPKTADLDRALASIRAHDAASKPRGCIAPLSAEDVRRIVEMRNKGMALQDIADATGRHLNTVWTHVSRTVARGECRVGRMTRRAKS